MDLFSNSSLGLNSPSSTTSIGTTKTSSAFQNFLKGAGTYFKNNPQVVTAGLQATAGIVQSLIAGGANQKQIEAIISQYTGNGFSGALNASANDKNNTKASVGNIVGFGLMLLLLLGLIFYKPQK